MGSLCFLVVVYCIIYGFSAPSFALSCSDLTGLKTCDECIKCGGIWCKDPSEFRKCVPATGGGDDWCPDHREDVSIEPTTSDGALIRPVYDDVLAEINAGKVTIVSIKNAQTLYFKVLNTTQPNDSKVDVQIEKTEESEIQVTTTIRDGFCSPTSRKFEYVFIEVGAGVEEKAVLKYHVPCACACSEQTEPRAAVCSGFGNLVCGACQCNVGRRGKLCECGPVSSSCVTSSSTTQKCSGNGVCDKCNRCQCYNDVNKPGSQYFDPEDNCKDLSSTVSGALDCLKNNGPCGKCDINASFHKWDGSLLNQTFDAARRLWVNLGPEMPDYWAYIMNSTIHIMRELPKC